MVASYALAAASDRCPQLGWTGIALGTAIGHCCGATIILALLIGGRAGYHLRLRSCGPTSTSSAASSRSASPAASTRSLVSICHLIYLRIILHLGDVAAAAHGVAIQVEALGYMPGGAFQIAAATMTGQYLGAGDFHRARHSVLIACGVAATVMMAAGIVFYVAAVPLSAFFLGGYKSNVLPLCVELLHVIAFVMLPLAVMMVLVGALRGAGDTRWPLALTLFGFIVIRVPLAMYLVDDTVHDPVRGRHVRRPRPGRRRRLVRGDRRRHGPQRPPHLALLPRRLAADRSLAPRHKAATASSVCRSDARHAAAERNSHDKQLRPDRKVRRLAAYLCDLSSP